MKQSPSKTGMQAAPRPAAVPVQAQVRQGEEAEGHILLIDDEEQVVAIVKEILENFGFCTTVCTSGSQALEIFHAAPGAFDLVITDYNMPGMNGLQLSGAIDKLRPDIPIVLFTGLLDISEEEARRHGISDFIMKPVMAHELLGLVRKVLRSSCQP